MCGIRIVLTILFFFIPPFLGVLKFARLIKSYESQDPEIASMSGKLKSMFLPPMTLPPHGAGAGGAVATSWSRQPLVGPVLFLCFHISFNLAGTWALFSFVIMEEVFLLFSIVLNIFLCLWIKTSCKYVPSYFWLRVSVPAFSSSAF